MIGSLLVKVTVLFSDKSPVVGAEVRGDTRVFADEDGYAEVNVSSNVTKKNSKVAGNVEVLYEGQQRVKSVEGERGRTVELTVDDIEKPPPPPKKHTLTIKSDPEGVGGVKPYNIGTHVDIPEGTEIELHQTVLKPGWEYAGWDYMGEPMDDKDLKFKLVADGVFTFNYKQTEVYHMMETHVEGVGNVLPLPGKGDFADGQEVHVTADPAPGWYLHHFELDGQVTEKLESFLMTKKRDLAIVFRKKHP